MNLWLKLVKDLRLQIFVVLMAIIAIIWFVLPYLEINNYYPFAPLEMRLAVILGLVVLWGTSNILLRPDEIEKQENTTEEPTEKTAEPNNSNWEYGQAKLKILQQSIKDGVNFLKLNYPKIFLKPKRLPWYLVIGPASAGKTSLITHSGITLQEPVNTHNEPTEAKIDHANTAVQLISQSANRPNYQKIHPTPYCDWWFGQNAVFLDISGSLLIQQTPDYNPNSIWQGFIKLLKPYCRKWMNGLIVVIDINSLSDRASSSIAIDSVCHHIQSLTKYVKKLPLFIVLTKCDLIAGFTDFFANISTEERQQTCGLTLGAIRNPQNFTKTLSQAYDDFLLRINQQLISRLHQEQNLKKRIRIKDFPLQIESFKNSIINFVNKLHSSKTNVCGIFFTSTVQEGRTVDYLMKPITQALNIPPIPTPINRAQHKPFFVQNLLLNNIFNQDSYYDYADSPQKRPIIALTSGAILIAVSSFLWQSYYHNSQILNNIRYETANLLEASSTHNSEYAYLNKLNQLLTILNQNQNYKTNKFLTAGFSQGEQLKTTITTKYNQTLTQQFIPQLQQILETQLQSGKTVDLQELYNTLKVYLMLGNPDKMNKSTVEGWFANYWRVNLANQPNLQNRLILQLNTLLENGQLQINLNPNLVKLVQQTLVVSGLPQLAYFRLEDENSTPTNLFANQAFTKYVVSGSTIASLYTAKNFNKIYNQAIPQIAQDINKSNWVLGDELSTNTVLSPAQNTNLINSLRILYVQNYVATWQQQLADIRFGNIDNINDLALFLKSLSTANSTITAILKTAQENLQPITSNPELKQQVSTQLQTLNTINLYANDYMTLKAISNLSNYVSTIDNASDIGKKALASVQLRMQTGGSTDAIGMLHAQAQKVPAPLNQWLDNVAYNSWRVILLSAQDYLNQVWVTQVIPQYEQTVKNRYPIFSMDDSEMSLADFTKFFGPQGTMQQFFNNYLQPLVNTSQLYWVWKEVDNQHVNIPQSTLEMFIRAALIQKMFFPNNSTNNVQTQFSLIPAAMEPTTQNFILNIDSQTVDYLQGLRQTSSIKWPNNKPNSALIQIITTDGQQFNLTETGPWALFKLLTKANLQATQNSKIYNLTFNLNGHTAKFELIANNIINPFIPGILSRFRCPDKL